MNARSILATQLDRVMKVGPVVNLALLIATLSLTFARFVYWRGGPLWAWVAGTGVAVAVAILLFAHIWTNKLDMVRASRRASAIHDPCQVYQIHPYERAIWLNVTIPQLVLQAQIAAKLGLDTSEISAVIGKMRRWEALGYIPRDEYPEHLLQYYWHEGAPL